jgi:hypothetical protein
MKDDPKKHRVDRRFVSSQPHEIAYVERKLARLYPAHSAAEIRLTVRAVKALITPSEGRRRFMAVCATVLSGDWRRVTPE